jgi:ribonuclease Z
MDSLSVERPDLIAGKLNGRNRRVLLFGESGSGKSTLAAALAREHHDAGRSCLCMGADPGSPAFGPPGAVCLSAWRGGGWRLLHMEALCTLDAGRFRLPLVSAVRKLAQSQDHGILLVDAPGIVRGVAGAELLAGLAEAADINTVLVVVRDMEKVPLANELAALGCEIFLLRASERARQPGKRQRARHRTRMWDAFLREARDRDIAVPRELLTGTPPPLEAKQDWMGRQIGFLAGGRTIALGEILDINRGQLRVRTGDFMEPPDEVLVRDAMRNSRGLLTTFRKTGPVFPLQTGPPDVAPWPVTEKITGPVPVTRIGEATGVLVNGVFGDPLLHLRLHNRRRSILFDLGEGARLPARLAHQVSDVFISHAHIDHICGFLWLMRSRIGMLQGCRLFGPPDLSDRVAGLMNGIVWDRIGEGGPRFEVCELHGDGLLVYRIQAGQGGKKLLRARPAAGGLLAEDQDFRARAVTLAHGTIPVLAFALEQAPKYNVRRECLARLNLEPGPWLGELKKRIGAGDRKSAVRLPDGTFAAAGELADDLLLVTPAQKLVYATDLSDTAANRRKLTELARGAHIFFCEAAFITADRQYAEPSGHLTTSACAEIAVDAQVGQLVPFHFSRRYERRSGQVYDEVRRFAKRIPVLEPRE